MIGDFFSLALNNIRRRKLRSWLTMLGIFIGIAAVVSLISLGQGLQTAVTGQFATLGTEFLTIQNAGTGFGPPGSTVVEKLNEHDLKIIENVRGVEITIPRLVRMVRIEYNDELRFKYIGSMPENKKQLEVIYESFGVGAKEGRLLKSDDFGRVLIGSNLAKKDEFGKVIETGKKITVQGKEYEVVGILKEASTFTINNMVMMLDRDMKELLNIEDEIDLIIAQVENPVRRDLSDVLPGSFKTEAVKEYKAPRMDSFSGSYGKKEIIKLGDSSAEYVRQGVVGCTCGQEISKDDKSSYANVYDSSSGSYGTGKQKQTKSYGT